MSEIVAINVSDHSRVIRVGQDGVTHMRLGEATGHLAVLKTIQVYKGDHLHAEYILVNCLGIIYQEPTDAQD